MKVVSSVTEMRINAVPSRRAGIFTRLVYWLTRRRLGQLVEPVTAAAHQPRLLWAMVQMELSESGMHSMDETLKVLASIKASTRIGCPF